jgi:hypothetical protein
MENRKKIGLLIIIIGLLILAIIIIMFLKKTKPSVDVISTSPIIENNGNLNPTDDIEMPTTTPGDRPLNYQTYDITKESPHALNANDAAKLSSSFAERLGSFSNQSDYGNVTDLKIFMTSSMRDWADKYVADLKAKPYSGEYYGIMTKSLTTKVLSYDDKKGTVKIEVVTERQESQASLIGATYVQKMTLDLVKINDEWLVDNAVWEKK